MFFLVVQFSNIRGIILSWSLTATSSIVHWMVSPEIVSKVSILLSIFSPLLFQVSPKARV